MIVFRYFRRAACAAALALVCSFVASCSGPESGCEVTLLTLDPGHFHAALVQKTQYQGVSPDVYVYAPEGDDLQQHLSKVEAYNSRSEAPTSWNEIVYTGDDFLEKMLSDKRGNVMVTAGNNRKKTEYILKTLQAGINVLSDKPMAISSDKFEMLEECFETAAQKGLLLYDIMTERFEISSILQKELAHIPAIYGEQLSGSLEQPGIEMKSVHNFYKNVSGNALVRPAWFYDVRQQGEGIADVMVHLVDLVQWQCFPEVAIDYTRDVAICGARHWPTSLSPSQFKASTGMDTYPDFLQSSVAGGALQVYANGEIDFCLKGINARTTVLWDFEAPAGAGDSHYCLMRGSRADLVIRQGAEQGYKPELYIEPAGNLPSDDIEEIFATAITSNYPGVGLEKTSCGWHVVIPESYRVGHEAHFGQVTENFLKYLSEGRLPSWEVPNMISKYYITTTAWGMVQ